jgi:hypothetical protein
MAKARFNLGDFIQPIAELLQRILSFEWIGAV